MPNSMSLSNYRATPWECNEVDKKKETHKEAENLLLQEWASERCNESTLNREGETKNKGKQNFIY